jgi:AraC-like DNA-binding protein
VHAALLELLPQGSTGSARSPDPWPSPLQRRLHSEGTSYQAELSATRQALAHHSLGNQDMTVGQIAFLLGYETPSSFYPRLHAWTGATPETARSSR